MASTESVLNFSASCPQSQKVDKDLESQLDNFIKHHLDSQGQLRRPLVVVTSGGTTVPLEKRCVRYIDNFTTGSRGALSVENFLDAGYAIIFLVRTKSMMPFEIKIGSDVTQILETFLESDENSKIRLKESKSATLIKLFSKLSYIKDNNLLFKMPYTTIFEYLAYLEKIAYHIRSLGSAVCFYLAAAVSDFYVPWEELPEHKIESVEGDLKLHLKGVPKALGILANTWAPSAYIVSFKLETDENILIKKAKGAIKRYGVDAVVANLLGMRKDTVVVVTGTDDEENQEVRINRRPDTSCIEEDIVNLIVRLHKNFILKNSSNSSSPFNHSFLFKDNAFK